MKMRMLIADDEVLICRLLQGIIHWEELGIECVGFASDGDGLLSMIKQMRPELVLTDICMPARMAWRSSTSANLPAYRANSSSSAATGSLNTRALPCAMA